MNLPDGDKIFEFIISVVYVLNDWLERVLGGIIFPSLVVTNEALKPSYHSLLSSFPEPVAEFFSKFSPLAVFFESFILTYLIFFLWLAFCTRNDSSDQNRSDGGAGGASPPSTPLVSAQENRISSLSFPTRPLLHRSMLGRGWPSNPFSFLFGGKQGQLEKEQQEEAKYELAKQERYDRRIRETVLQELEKEDGNSEGTKCKNLTLEEALEIATPLQQFLLDIINREEEILEKGGKETPLKKIFIEIDHFAVEQRRKNWGEALLSPNISPAEIDTIILKRAKERIKSLSEEERKELLSIDFFSSPFETELPLSAGGQRRMDRWLDERYRLSPNIAQYEEQLRKAYQKFLEYEEVLLSWGRAEEEKARVREWEINEALGHAIDLFNKGKALTKAAKEERASVADWKCVTSRREEQYVWNLEKILDNVIKFEKKYLLNEFQEAVQKELKGREAYLVQFFGEEARRAFSDREDIRKLYTARLLQYKIERDKAQFELEKIRSQMQMGQTNRFAKERGPIPSNIDQGNPFGGKPDTVRAPEWEIHLDKLFPFGHRTYFPLDPELTPLLLTIHEEKEELFPLTERETQFIFPPEVEEGENIPPVKRLPRGKRLSALEDIAEEARRARLHKVGEAVDQKSTPGSHIECEKQASNVDDVGGSPALHHRCEPGLTSNGGSHPFEGKPSPAGKPGEKGIKHGKDSEPLDSDSFEPIDPSQWRKQVAQDQKKADLHLKQPHPMSDEEFQELAKSYQPDMLNPQLIGASLIGPQREEGKKKLSVWELAGLQRGDLQLSEEELATSFSGVENNLQPLTSTNFDTEKETSVTDKWKPPLPMILEEEGVSDLIQQPNEERAETWLGRTSALLPNSDYIYGDSGKLFTERGGSQASPFPAAPFPFQQSWKELEQLEKEEPEQPEQPKQLGRRELVEQLEKEQLERLEQLEKEQLEWLELMRREQPSRVPLGDISDVRGDSLHLHQRCHPGLTSSVSNDGKDMRGEAENLFEFYSSFSTEDLFHMRMQVAVEQRVIPPLPPLWSVNSSTVREVISTSLPPEIVRDFFALPLGIRDPFAVKRLKNSFLEQLKLTRGDLSQLTLDEYFDYLYLLGRGVGIQNLSTNLTPPGSEGNTYRALQLFMKTHATFSPGVTEPDYPSFLLSDYPPLPFPTFLHNFLEKLFPFPLHMNRGLQFVEIDNVEEEIFSFSEDEESPSGPSGFSASTASTPRVSPRILEKFESIDSDVPDEESCWGSSGSSISNFSPRTDHSTNSYFHDDETLWGSSGSSISNFVPSNFCPHCETAHFSPCALHAQGTISHDRWRGSYPTSSFPFPQSWGRVGSPPPSSLLEEGTGGFLSSMSGLRAPSHMECAVELHPSMLGERTTSNIFDFTGTCSMLGEQTPPNIFHVALAKSDDISHVRPGLHLQRQAQETPFHGSSFPSSLAKPSALHPRCTPMIDKEETGQESAGTLVTALRGKIGTKDVTALQLKLEIPPASAAPAAHRICESSALATGKVSSDTSTRSPLDQEAFKQYWKQCWKPNPEDILPLDGARRRPIAVPLQERERVARTPLLADPGLRSNDVRALSEIKEMKWRGAGVTSSKSAPLPVWGERSPSFPLQQSSKVARMADQQRCEFFPAGAQNSALQYQYPGTLQGCGAGPVTNTPLEGAPTDLPKEVSDLLILFTLEKIYAVIPDSKSREILAHIRHKVSTTIQHSFYDSQAQIEQMRLSIQDQLGSDLDTVPLPPAGTPQANFCYGRNKLTKAGILEAAGLKKPSLRAPQREESQKMGIDSKGEYPDVPTDWWDSLEGGDLLDVLLRLVSLFFYYLLK